MAKRRTKKNTSRRENNGIKVFALVMLIVLLLGIVAGAIVLGVKSDGFKNWDFIPGNGNNTVRKFDVLKGGVSVKSVDVSEESSVRIDVVNGGDFDVTVRPKASADFDFMLDGKLHAFAQADGDYNRAFDLKIEDGYFTVNVPKNIVNALNDAYFGHVITDVRCNYVGTFFEIVVTSQKDDSKKIDVTGIYSTPLTVTISPSEVIF